jgi:hypothetical protein
MNPGAQNMKTRPDALDTDENEFGSTKHEKREPTPSVPLKMSLGTQNIKIEPDALGTVKNMSGSGKHKSGT